MTLKLPIDVIPGSNPPRFRWTYEVEPSTGRTQECEGALPPSVERAVIELIKLAKRQQIEIEKLRQQVADLNMENVKLTQIYPSEPDQPPQASRRRR